MNEDIRINFSHLSDEGSLFPFCCLNGYFLLWDVFLPAPEMEEEERPEVFVRKEIKRLKQKNNK